MDTESDIPSQPAPQDPHFLTNAGLYVNAGPREPRPAERSPLRASSRGLGCRGQQPGGWDAESWAHAPPLLGALSSWLLLSGLPPLPHSQKVKPSPLRAVRVHTCRLSRAAHFQGQARSPDGDDQQVRLFLRSWRMEPFSPPTPFRLFRQAPRAEAALMPNNPAPGPVAGSGRMFWKGLLDGGTSVSKHLLSPFHSLLVYAR